MDNREHPARDILADALEISDPQQRANYISQACGSDLGLRHEVEELLLAELSVGGFLPDRPAAGWVQAAVAGAAGASGSAGSLSGIPMTEKPGDQIGSYTLLQKLGEGGYGVVYLADQSKPVRRRVALKIIKLGMDTREVVARFDAERQALAMMDHPNIAKVLDAGATHTGRPFFVMELVQGIRITRYCDQHELSVRERLELFMQVCQAVQHAHLKGIIHRDLKPSNILVTKDEAGLPPVPKVIDFGIAKATTGKLTDQTLVTGLAQLMGTPAYMSPEQVTITSHDIDTRSDIYSLGVLLYELLTGHTPFDTKVLLGLGIDELRRVIIEEEPKRPSTRLAMLGHNESLATAGHRNVTPPRLAPLVRGDLDWIVMKCLEKDRNRRYETANELAMDLRRHLSNEPVLARRPGRAYRFQKWTRRHKATFAAVSAVMLALILGLVASLWLLVKERAARFNEAKAEQLARDESVRAAAAARETRLTLSVSDFLQAVRLADQENGLEALAYLSRSLTLNPTNQASLTRLSTLLIYHRWMLPRLSLQQAKPLRTAQFSPDGKRIVTASDDGTARLWDAMTGQPLGEPMKHGDSVRWAQFSPDGKWVVTTSFDHTARVWDAYTGKAVSKPMRHRDKVIYAQFSPDSKRVVTASDDATARIWDALSGEPLTKPVVHGHWVRSARFSRDGKRIVTASNDSTARVWDALTGEPLTASLRHGAGVFWAEFSPDGTRIVTAAEDGARVWNAETGQPVTELLRHDRWVRYAEFSPDGRRVATAASDATARVWDSATGRPLTPFMKHNGGLRSVHFSPDGERLVTAAFDGTARLWDSQTGRPLIEPLNHTAWVRSAQFSADGQQVLTACDDGGARVWGPETSQPLTQTLRHADGLVRAQFSPNGDRILTASKDSTARTWDPQTCQPLMSPMRHAGPIRWAQFSPDGRRVATCSSDHTAQVWNSVTGQPVTPPMCHNGAVLCAHFSPDGTRVVTASEDHTARVWDAQTGKPLTPPLEHSGIVFWAQFSPDGKHLLTSADDSAVHLWDAQTGVPTTAPLSHNGWTLQAQFSPNGRQIVTVSDEGTARVWNAENGRPITRWLAHGGWVVCAQFSPDGKRVVTASDDGTARVWDAQTGESLAQPLRHNGSVKWVEFSPDGTRLVTASLDHTARVWDAKTGQPLTEPLKHLLPVRYAQFSPDGKQIVTASDDGTAVIWDIGPSGTAIPNWLLMLAQTISGQTLNKDDVLERNTGDRVSALRQIRQELDQAPADDPWARLGRWFLADPSNRTISPYSKVPASDYLALKANQSQR